VIRTKVSGDVEDAVEDAVEGGRAMSSSSFSMKV